MTTGPLAPSQHAGWGVPECPPEAWRKWPPTPAGGREKTSIDRAAPVSGECVELAGHELDVGVDEAGDEFLEADRGFPAEP